MISFKIYQVFSKEELGYKGNTAAVVMMDYPLEKENMQAIAADLNQPATSFLWKEHKVWNNRWFAPDEEINLCGHGACASIAFFKDEAILDHPINLSYPEGLIVGINHAMGITLQLNTIPVVKKIDPPKAIVNGLGVPIIEMYETGNKHIIIVDREEDVKDMVPDFSKLRESKIFGYAVTAPGNEVDFVSRTLVPHVNQLEDPATGSSHALLTPFWADKLKKRSMVARQLSKRGGYFECELYGTYVKLTGEYKMIAKGELLV